MKPSSILLGSFVAVLAISQGACDTQGFGKPRGGRRLTVELKGQDDEKVVGSRLSPLNLSIDEPQPFKIVVRALDQNGNVDTGFNGYVRVSSKPGAIERIDSPDADGRSLKLMNGESPETEVEITNAYGTTYILADDLGYAPADPLGTPRPACANGADDDKDGKNDFPTDEGCAYANDDTEEGGSYAQGASPPIFYRLPRVADVRGLKCSDPNDTSTCSGAGKTPYPKEQILLDTGYHDKPDGTQAYDFDMVVTRISSDGFYVTDTKDERGGFNSVFSFNFNAPPRMRVCDRLKTFAGTATEFFGLTQISYPTWTLEEWDPQKRPCLVPEPHALEPTEICPPAATGGCGTPLLLPYSASLVRALSSDGKLAVKVTPKFGPGDTPEQGGVFVPSPDATNCDLNKDGKIDFTAGNPEQRCSDACTNDVECTEYSNFAARSTFRLTIVDTSNGNSAAIQADATASTDFKPLERKGQPIKAFTGTLHFFSGGAQYTIEARCKDDIVLDMKAQPLPSDKACVFPRTVLDENPQ
jgi:hypothetical protein